MPTKTKPIQNRATMSAMDAIYQRRAVRDYKPQQVDRETIKMLLNAAVHAPTAMHEEPWAFAVTQDQDMLNRLSEHAKKLVRQEASVVESRASGHALELVNKSDFHVFYNASMLIVIYSKFQGPFVTADCWLAAENLMLAACAHGLGTCVIGFSVSALNTPEWKAELGISKDMTAVVPIIIGVPNGVTPPVPRKAPEIVIWK